MLLTLMEGECLPTYLIYIYYPPLLLLILRCITVVDFTVMVLLSNWRTLSLTQILLPMDQPITVLVAQSTQPSSLLIQITTLVAHRNWWAINKLILVIFQLKRYLIKWYCCIDNTKKEKKQKMC